jgi:ribose transport system permease protein
MKGAGLMKAVKMNVQLEEGQLPREHKKRSFGWLLVEYNGVVIFICLFIAASLISPLFLGKMNILTVLRQQVAYLLIAMGMLLVIITGGIDLSVSSVTGVCSVVCGVAMRDFGLNGGGIETLIVILISILCGVVFGSVNGLLVAKFHMPAFIVTLAMMYAAKGIAFIITKSNTVIIDTTSRGYLELTSFATQNMPGIGIPWCTLFAIVVVAVFFLVMKYSIFGRMVYAVGSNESAVKLAGINSKKYLFSVYVINGMMCGLAGMMLVARAGNASALAANGDYDMSTIAAVVIGGASLMGGEGSVLMTVLGVFIIAMITNIMNLINVATYPQLVVKAAVIILAVILKQLTNRKRA